jgi:hypothetical protein
MAATRTIDSNHVGSCHTTTSPGPMPRSLSAAATRSLRVANSAKVILRPLSSTAISASGVASTRLPMSSHSVRPSSIYASPCCPPAAPAAI